MRKFALAALTVALIAANLLSADLLFAQAPAPITSPAYVEVPAPRQEIITAAPSPQARIGSRDIGNTRVASTNGRPDTGLLARREQLSHRRLPRRRQLSKCNLRRRWA